MLTPIRRLLIVKIDFLNVILMNLSQTRVETKT
jgi:hypothetical protein